MIYATASYAFSLSGGKAVCIRRTSPISSSAPIPSASLFLRRKDVIGDRSKNHRTCGTDSIRMSVEGDFDHKEISKAKQEVESGSSRAKLRALYKFTRPHTIRGTILASIAGTIRALIDTPGAIGSARWATMLPRAFVGMIALLLGNAFIVGINQIYDKEIDEMNKPFLPVASGEMTKRSAWAAVILSGVVGPILVKTLFPPLLFKLYCFGLVLPSNSTNSPPYLRLTDFSSKYCT